MSAIFVKLCTNFRHDFYNLILKNHLFYIINSQSIYKSFPRNLLNLRLTQA